MTIAEERPLLQDGVVEPDEELVPFTAITEAVGGWRARKEREKARDKAFAKLWPYLRKAQDDVESSLEWLTAWEDDHLQDAADELQAWLVGTRGMFERRQQLLEQIEKLLGALDDNLGEENKRADMLDLLLELAEQEQS